MRGVSMGQGVCAALAVNVLAGIVVLGCERREDEARQPAEARPGQVEGVQGEIERAPQRVEEETRRGLEDLQKATEDLARDAREVAEDAGRRAEEIGRDVDAETSEAAARLAESLDQAARSLREEAREGEASRASAGEATAVRLRDCDLGGPFYFFFEPGSSALRQQDLNHASQLNHCLSRAEGDEGLVVVGYAELGTDDQSSVSLALTRAHNVAQRVAMDGVVSGNVVVEATAPQRLPKDEADFGRRVEVRVQR